MGRRLALLIATYEYEDAGLRRLTAPAHDAEALAAVLQDPSIAGFEVRTLVNEPFQRVGKAVGDFYHERRSDDTTLLYFTGHGLKDDYGRLYLAMADTHRDNLRFTALSANHLDEEIDGCASRQKILILDCCYSGAYPAGRLTKADPAVGTLDRFRGQGCAVLTASDSTQYAFEGETLRGQAPQSVFTRHLVQGLRDGSADLDGDGDITLDELYSYVHDHVVEEMPQQRPKRKDNIEGRIWIARNVNWSLPGHVSALLDNPVAEARLVGLNNLEPLYRNGNDHVRAKVVARIGGLTGDDSQTVSAAAKKLLRKLGPGTGPAKVKPSGLAVFPWRIHQFVLDNDLRVVVSPDPTTPIAAVNLWYLLGSRHEVSSKYGLAHLCNHLMFAGSAQVANGEHSSLLQAVGGSGINATTSADRTSYYQTVPSPQLELALWLEADRMGSLAMTRDGLEIAREVKKNERRRRYDLVPYGRWSEVMLALAYPEGHPYHHSTIGSMASLDGASLSDVRGFYETYYSPDNAVLTVAGDVDAKQVHALAEQYFGGLPARPRPMLKKVAALPPGLDGPIRLVLEEPVPSPRLFFGFRSTRFGHPGEAAEEVLATVLGRGRGARLHTELVSRRELAQTEGSHLASWQMAWHESLLSGMASPRPGVHPEELEAAYFEVCERVAVDAPTEAELDRARGMLAADQARELSALGSRADQLSMYAVLFGDAEEVRNRLSAVLAVTAEDVRAAAERIFAPNNRITLEYRVGGSASGGSIRLGGTH